MHRQLQLSMKIGHVVLLAYIDNEMSDKASVSCWFFVVAVVVVYFILFFIFIFCLFFVFVVVVCACLFVVLFWRAESMSF